MHSSSSSLHVPDKSNKSDGSDSQDVALDISADDSSSDIIIHNKSKKDAKKPPSRNSRKRVRRSAKDLPRNPSLSDSGSDTQKNEEKEPKKQPFETLQTPESPVKQPEPEKVEIPIRTEPPQKDEEIAIIIPAPATVKSLTYSITRIKPRLKNVYTFEFSQIPQESDTPTQVEEVIYSAKCKGRFPKSPIPINKGKEIHLSKASDFVLIPSNNATVFTLKKALYDIPALMDISVKYNMQNLLRPRTITVHINTESGIPKQDLVTRTPKMLRNGMFALDFHNRFTIPSEKNAIFYDQKNGPSSADICSVRKIGLDTLEIIASENLPSNIVFGIGLVLFTADLGA